MKKKLTLLLSGYIHNNLISMKAMIEEIFSEAKTPISRGGPKSLELAAAGNPDLILPEIFMPGMGSFEVCLKNYQKA